MPQYLLTAKTSGGRKVTELVTADSARAAIDDLKSRGYDGIVLHTDDAGAQVVKPMQMTPLLGAYDIVQNRSRSSIHQNVLMVLGAYRTMWKLLAAIGAIFFLRRYLDVPWGLLDGPLVAALLLPVIVAYLSRFPVVRYHRLLEAQSWRRGEEVLRLLPRVSRLLTPAVAAWHQAKALASLGRLDEALAVFTPFSGSDELPMVRFWPMLAGVYRVAKEDELAVSAYEQALELAPHDPAVLVGLANALLDIRGDAHRASELVNRARQQPLSDVAEPLTAMAEGMIAIEDGNSRLAIAKLEPALRCQRRFAKGHPTSAAAADMIEGKLALAKAMAGDLEAARDHFRRAEPRLRALKSERLLARCQQAIGIMSATPHA
ncbi:MAG TPA: hypothetical protein VF306_09345 [Pirellulales bacterium]